MSGAGSAEARVLAMDQILSLAAAVKTRNELEDYIKEYL
jgi:hypothetical protein